MISHIAAVNKNRVIGAQGELPWKISEDLKYFKARTLNKCIIMGRKTFESLGKPLPGRYNVVITRDKSWSHPGVEVFTNILAAIKHCQSLKDKYGEEIMIVGGAEIYSQTLFLAQRLYLTLIENTVDGDAFYPDWDQDFSLTEKVDREENGQKFSFCLFERNKNLQNPT